MSTYTTGPGSLVFGAPGDPLEIAAQVTSCTVEWDVESEDDIPVLSGDIVAGEETHTAQLSGNLFQDISETGITSWSWENKGTTVPFTFIPADLEARHVTGMVKVRALAVGGEVKKKATSDFEFPCVGEPELGDVAP